MSSALGVRTLARRYARALADASPRDRTVIADALEGWRQTCIHTPSLPAVLKDPRVPKPRRIDLAREIFTKLGGTAILINLITLLIEDNRMNLLDSIHEVYLEEREQREGIQTVVLETAAALPEQTRERIRSRLAEMLRLHIRIVEQTRPPILGGMNLRIGSRVWYGSALNRLRRLFH